MASRPWADQMLIVCGPRVGVGGGVGGDSHSVTFVPKNFCTDCEYLDYRIIRIFDKILNI